MNTTSPYEIRLDRLIVELARLLNNHSERSVLSKTILALEDKYGLSEKIREEPGVKEIIAQMVGRLANTALNLAELRGMKILDIACGSNTSKAPGWGHIKTFSDEMSFGHMAKEYTSQFEPWFCRIVFELGANIVGVDIGDLEDEVFTHYQVDLGKKGALDFLPDHSFDAIQDSRLFGSPEFTHQFPEYADHLKVAREITRQEKRLIKLGGIIIHSDAQDLAG